MFFSMFNHRKGMLIHMRGILSRGVETTNQSHFFGGARMLNLRCQFCSCDFPGLLLTYVFWGKQLNNLMLVYRDPKKIEKSIIIKPKKTEKS